MAIKHQPGDVIVKCRPLCLAVHRAEKGRRCDLCLQSNSSLKKCGKCGKMTYCGKTCQVSDWTGGHKYECDIYAECGPEVIEITEVRFMVRLYLLVTKGQVDTKKFTLPDGRERCLTDLISHEDDVKESGSTEDLIRFMQICAKLEKLGLKEAVTTNKNLLFRLYCQMIINSFTLNYEGTWKDEPAANALYVEASIFNHSCDANACRIQRGNELEIRAMKPIEEGGEVFINYHGAFDTIFEETKDVRQAHLKSKYFFTCKCTRCESDFDITLDRKKVIYLTEQMDANVNRGKYQAAFNCGTELWPIWRQVYGEFHPNLTGRLMQLMQIGLMADIRGSKEFTHLLDSLEMCLEVTEIKGGFLYNRTKRMIEETKSGHALPGLGDMTSLMASLGKN